MPLLEVQSLLVRHGLLDARQGHQLFARKRAKRSPLVGANGAGKNDAPAGIGRGLIASPADASPSPALMFTARPSHEKSSRRHRASCRKGVACSRA